MFEGRSPLLDVVALVLSGVAIYTYTEAEVPAIIIGLMALVLLGASKLQQKSGWHITGYLGTRGIMVMLVYTALNAVFPSLGESGAIFLSVVMMAVFDLHITYSELLIIAINRQ